MNFEPKIDDDYYEEIPPTKEEILEMYIEYHLEMEEAELEEIKEADRRRID